MSVLCIAVAGAIQTVISTTSFTLAWTHSIEKIRWEEDYLIAGDRLELRESRIKGSGAGMEPPPSAVLQDGWWKYRPALLPLPRLQLANSAYTEDYLLCWQEQCRPLHSLLPARAQNQSTELFPCALP